MKKAKLIERRGFPRLNQDVPFKLLLEGFDIGSETKNISASGLYCRVDKHLDLMTKLKMVIMLPNQPLTKKIICSGVVVRTETDLTGRSHIAVFFTDIKRADQEKIANYIKQNLR